MRNTQLILFVWVGGYVLVNTFNDFTVSLFSMFVWVGNVGNACVSKDVNNLTIGSKRFSNDDVGSDRASQLYVHWCALCPPEIDRSISTTRVNQQNEVISESSGNFVEEMQLQSQVSVVL